MSSTANTGQGTPAQPSRLASVGGLVAVGLGVAAIFMLALAAVFLLAFKLSSPTDAVVAVATGAFGVIGSVVGAYFGVKVGTDQSKPIAAAAASATEAAAAAHARSEAIALHVSPENAARALDAANAAVSAMHAQA